MATSGVIPTIATWPQQGHAAQALKAQALKTCPDLAGQRFHHDALLMLHMGQGNDDTCRLCHVGGLFNMACHAMACHAMPCCAVSDDIMLHWSTMLWLTT